MKTVNRVHGAMLIAALTVMFLMVDVGIYIGTGRSRLVDLSQKVERFVFLNKKKLTKVDVILNTVHGIDTKVDTLTKKFNQHEAEHQKMNRRESNLNNLINKQNAPIGVKTTRRMTIIAKQIPLNGERNVEQNTERNEEGSRLPGQIFEKMLRTNDVSEVDKMMSQNPNVNFNIPFITIRKFPSRDAYMKYKENVSKYGNRPEFERGAMKKVVSMKEVVNAVKGNKNKETETQNGVDFKKVNGVDFKSVKPAPKQATDVEKAQQKIDKVLREKSVVEKKAEKPNAVGMGTLIAEDFKNAQRKREEIRRVRRAHEMIQRKKMMAMMYRIAKEKQKLRQKKMEYLKNRELKNKELMMLRALRMDNQELVRSNVELIKMTQDLLRSVNNTRDKLKKMKNETKQKKKSQAKKLESNKNTQQEEMKKKDIQKKIDQKEKVILEELEQFRKNTPPKLNHSVSEIGKIEKPKSTTLSKQ